MELLLSVAAVVVGYLLGSFPTGLVLGKLLRGIDVRDYGSGKTGATNALRTLGTGPSLVVFLGDLVKGMLAVLLARFLVHSAWAEVAAGLAAVAGHNWPVFAGFRGGRGVTTSFGLALITVPIVAVVGVVVFAGSIAVTRYVSLGSILGAVSVPLLTIPFVITGQSPVAYFVLGLLGASLILAKHHDNIARLRAGTERKLGQKEDLGRPSQQARA